MIKNIIRNLTISQKLTFSYFLIGIFSLIMVSVIYYYAFREALLERTFAQLSSINILKKAQVEDFIVQQKMTNENYYTKDLTKLEDILQEHTGMGETGETYLVGKDHKMKTKSRFFPNKKPEDIIVNSKAITEAILHKEGHGMILDYRGEEVISYFRMIKYPGIEWIIVSEIDFGEAMKPVNKVRNYIIGVVLVFTAMIVYLTLLLSKKIANPIIILRNSIEQLSLGKIPTKKFHYKDNDEIGQMVFAIDQLIEGIKRTTAFAFETGQGNFQATFEPLSKDDILGNTLIQMRNRIVELQQKQLSLARQRSAAIVEGQEKERQRLARELHDGLGQLLMGIRFKMEALKTKDEDKEEIKNLLDETIAEVRRMAHNAMPAALMDFGLESALRALCVRVAHLGNIQIEYDFVLDEKKELLDFEISTTLYRIAQEGLNNMLKYSKASKALVEVYKEENAVVLEFSDNGTGFNTELKKSSGNGLRNIKERAKLCGGKAFIVSEEGKGTKIRIVLPLVHE
ncbi:MAG TPA: histidine kinase [Cytophagaceae bacterium]|nr:histidine kinase [Cytophagaceae bacterium]